MACVVLAGCASKSQTGAAVGTAGGAVIGGVIGKVAGSTSKGAIIGAVVGGTAGAIIGAQMDKQAKELEQNIKGATIERVGEGIQVTFASGLLYDFDSDFVRPEARVNLGELAKSLAQYPNISVPAVTRVADATAGSIPTTLRPIGIRLPNTAATSRLTIIATASTALSAVSPRQR
jgi:hypothetical protein